MFNRNNIWISRFIFTCNREIPRSIDDAYQQCHNIKSFFFIISFTIIMIRVIGKIQLTTFKSIKYFKLLQPETTVLNHFSSKSELPDITDRCATYHTNFEPIPKWPPQTPVSYSFWHSVAVRAFVCVLIIDVQVFTK